MKKLLLYVVTIFLIYISASGQNYQKFPENNFFWNYWLSYYDGMPCMGSNDQFVKLYFGTDTTINSFVYHRLYRSSAYIPYTGCGAVYTIGPIFEDHIRQDTITKKVFRFNQNSQTDTILFDFDLTLGQIHPPTQLVPANTIYVSSIDSVLLGDGKHHKIFNFKNIDSNAFSSFCDDTTSIEFISLIEGVGFTRGFPYGSEYGGITDGTMMVNSECAGLNGLPPKLQCFGTSTQLFGNVSTIFDNYSHKDSVYYDNTGSLCNISLSTENLKAEDILVFPNPVSDYLQIVKPYSIEIKYYQIIDLQGKIIKQEASGNSVNNIIVSDLLPGLYFIVFNSNKAFKFIKD